MKLKRRYYEALLERVERLEKIAEAQILGEIVPLNAMIWAQVRSAKKKLDQSIENADLYGDGSKASMDLEPLVVTDYNEGDNPAIKDTSNPHCWTGIKISDRPVDNKCGTSAPVARDRICRYCFTVIKGGDSCHRDEKGEWAHIACWQRHMQINEVPPSKQTPCNVHQALTTKPDFTHGESRCVCCESSNYICEGCVEELAKQHGLIKPPEYNAKHVKFMAALYEDQSTRYKPQERLLWIANHLQFKNSLMGKHIFDWVIKLMDILDEAEPASPVMATPH